MNNDKCAICLEEIKEENVKLKCNHKYCVNCFVLHSRVSNKCPLCRREYSKPINKTRFSSNLDISDDVVTEIHTSLLTHYIVYNKLDDVLMNIENFTNKEDKQNYINIIVSEIIISSINGVRLWYNNL